MLYEANDMRMRMMMMMMMLMMMLMIYCQLFHVAIQEIFAERVSRWVVCVLIAQRTTGMQSYPAQESNQSDSDQMRLLKPAILHTHHLLFFIIFIIHPPSPPNARLLAVGSTLTITPSATFPVTPLFLPHCPSRFRLNDPPNPTVRDYTV